MKISFAMTVLATEVNSIVKYEQALRNMVSTLTGDECVPSGLESASLETVTTELPCTKGTSGVLQLIPDDFGGFTVMVDMECSSERISKVCELYTLLANFGATFPMAEAKRLVGDLT